MDFREALKRALPYPARVDEFIADLADDGFCIMPIEKRPEDYVPNFILVSSWYS